MLKRHTFWLWTAVIFLFLNALIHSLSFFISPVPHNETERQLFTLMTEAKLDMGAGFHRTMKELVTALSSCVTLLFLLAGLVNAFLLKKNAPNDILKGVAGIEIMIFVAGLVVFLVFAFLLPILLTGVICLLLLAGFFTIPKTGRT